MSGQMFKPLILMSILAVSLLFLHSVSVSWASDEAAGAGHELAVIGEAGAKAIDIKISAQKHGGGAPGRAPGRASRVHPVRSSTDGGVLRRVMRDRWWS